MLKQWIYFKFVYFYLLRRVSAHWFLNPLPMGNQKINITQIYYLKETDLLVLPKKKL